MGHTNIPFVQMDRDSLDRIFDTAIARCSFTVALRCSSKASLRPFDKSDIMLKNSLFEIYWLNYKTAHKNCLLQRGIHKSSLSQMFFKLDILKYLAIFTGKTPATSLFKKVANSNTCFFLWILQNFHEHLLW